MATITVSIDPVQVPGLAGPLCQSAVVDFRRSVTDLRTSNFGASRYAIITCYDGPNATGNVLGTATIDGATLLSTHGANGQEVVINMFGP